jgi:hypothetical protein
MQLKTTLTNKLYKTAQIVAISFALTLLNFTPNTIHAQNTCNRLQGFAYLGSTFSDLTLNENFGEYLKDILGLNNDCNFQDIAALKNRQSSITQQIRNQAFNCRFDNIPNLETQLKNLRLEEFYLRNFVIFVDGKIIKTQEDQLFQQALSSFQSGKFAFTDTEIQTQFKDFNEKYKDKVEIYNTCGKSPWIEVSTKWQQLTQTLSSLGKSDPTKKSTFTQKTNTNNSKNSPTGKSDSFLKSRLTIGQNLSSPMRRLSEIQTQLTQTSSATISQLHQVFQIEATIKAEQLDKQDLINRYEILFGQSGDKAVEELVKNLQSINSNIKETTNLSVRFTSCAQQTAAKQCSK